METTAVLERSAAARVVAAGRRRERLFYTCMAVAVVLTVFTGFARTYFLRPYYDARPLPSILHLHGLVFTSWVALFLVQTSLVAAKRTDVHRRLGFAGAALASLMVLVGTLTAVVRAKAMDVPPGLPSPLSFLAVPLGDLLVFALLVGAGFYFRRWTAAHKRLMLLSMIAILPAAVARIPLGFIEQGGALAYYGLSDLFIAPCLLQDILTRGRPQRATVLGGLLIVATQPLRFVVGNTHAWIAFATWLTQWTN